MSRAAGLASSLALVFAVSFGAPAFAAPPAERDATAALDAADQLYIKLDYEGANAAVRKVIAGRDLTHDQLVGAYRLLAITYATLDKAEQARDAFFHLLVIEPEYVVDPNLGPKVSTPFVEARAKVRALPVKPGLDVAAAGRGTIRVKTRDPTRIVRKVVVGYRWGAGGTFTRVELKPASAQPDGYATTEVAPGPAGQARIDFFALGIDEHGSAAFEAGSEAEPRTAFLEGKPAPAKAESGGGGRSLVKPEQPLPPTACTTLVDFCERRCQ